MERLWDRHSSTRLRLVLRSICVEQCLNIFVISFLRLIRQIFVCLPLIRRALFVRLVNKITQSSLRSSHLLFCAIKFFNLLPGWHLTSLEVYRQQIREAVQLLPGTQRGVFAHSTST